MRAAETSWNCTKDFNHFANLLRVSAYISSHQIFDRSGHGSISRCVIGFARSSVSAKHAAGAGKFSMQQMLSEKMTGIQRGAKALGEHNEGMRERNSMNCF
jgi:hypothetical protein